jgi:hypothetical protein
VLVPGVADLGEDEFPDGRRRGDGVVVSGDRPARRDDRAELLDLRPAVRAGGQVLLVVA